MFRTHDLVTVMRKHPRRALASIGAVCCIGIFALVVNYLFISQYNKYIVTMNSLSQSTSTIAVVFGGGIENGKPRPLLQDRLDTAAKLLENGKVRKLVLSGDNRTESYDEPRAMYDYLVTERQIAANKLQLDSAGRSTYETCERAKKIFSLDQAILISESTHLPRAIYTCRSFGVKAIGVSSDGQSSAGLKVGQRWREVLARTKATLNIYFVGEPTVLGEQIKL